MTKVLKLCLILLLLAVAPGCWGSSEIQNIAYSTSLGFDYEDDQFIVYAQVLNFSNIAKSENFEIGTHKPPWIGKGRGKTVLEAVDNIRATSQIPLLWGHTKTIVFSERILDQKKAMREAYDAVNRYREMRYHVLIYGTEMPIETIFSQTSILEFPPIHSLLRTPERIYADRSYIAPCYGYRFIAQLEEPGAAVQLPTLSVDRKAWSVDGKNKGMLRINGANYISKSRKLGWLSEDDLRGSRWLERMKRAPINVPNDDSPAATMVLHKPRHRIKAVVRDGSVKYSISVRVKGYISELLRDIPEEELEKEAAKVIEKEIVSTFRKGLAIKADVLHLEETLYRKDPKGWERMHRGDEDSFVLTEDSLDRVDVKVTIKHTGSYKHRLK